MKIPYQDILKQAEFYKEDMSQFLRDMIAIPSESCDEEKVVLRIKEEMERVGFDKIEIDPMGNILGYIGTGSHLIAMDAHIDTVGVGEIDNWECDPYLGKVVGDVIYGRGGSDQEGGMASMVLIIGTVQEEDCDGLCWQYIVNESNIRPEFVVITEPTSCNIYRGHRGRMEIKVSVSGISCHGSAPERGDNAIYKIAPILMDLQELHPKLLHNDFLGKGSLTVSEIFYSSPSRCAVADGCSISIDRRLTDGETFESALEEIRNLPSVKKVNATVEMYDYNRPAYTGLVYPTKSYFPTWVLDEKHIVCESTVDAFRGLFNNKPIVDKWTFSTNAVSIMGRYNIPCIGFGPGHEEEAHAPNEKQWKSELVKACAMYTTIPLAYINNLHKEEK